MAVMITKITPPRYDKEKVDMECAIISQIGRFSRMLQMAHDQAITPTKGT